MSAKNDLKSEQTDLWNGRVGAFWVEAQETFDAMLRPFAERIVEDITALRPKAVLDIGCGSGATTLALKRALGDGTHVTGIDLSSPLVQNAIARASADGLDATFIRADASEHDFGARKFDVLTSRFGVMFFPDPVAAFANLRRAADEQAEAVFIVWRSPDENPFMSAPPRAAAPFLPDMPQRRPTDPGPFAFADPDHVRSVLSAGGWTGIDLQPIDVACRFPSAALEDFIERPSPVVPDLDALDADVRTEILSAIRAAYAPFVDGADVRFTGCCWIIRARAG